MSELLIDGTKMSTDEEETGGGVEMTNLNESKEGCSTGNGTELYRPAVRRQNCCFGFGLVSCLVAAAVIYVLAGVYASPSFTTGEIGVNEYDSGSGEVGLDAENAKTQELVDEDVENAVGAKGNHAHGKAWGKGKSNPMNWWNHGGKDKENPFGHLGTHHAGQGKDWVQNVTYWRDHPDLSPTEVDEDKLKKLQKLYNRNRTRWDNLPVGEDGMCTLKNGRKVPCPTRNKPTDKTKSEGNNDAATSAGNQDKGYTKITLQDGKKFEVLETLKHDPKSFTQGLTYADGKLFESTGLYGHSKVRQLNPDTGEVIKSVDMEAKYFGEGMTYYDKNKLIQITWKKRKGFIYDSNTLDVIDEFEFSTTKNEGWGITYDPSDRTLIVSDGSAYLHFWDADKPGEDKKDRPKVKVTRQSGQPATDLNELEFVNGKVIANVWYGDFLLVIDPKTGTCEKEFDFSSLWPKKERKRAKADVLNGVSVSGEKGVLYITGKLWNRMYKIKLFGMDELEQDG